MFPPSISLRTLQAVAALLAACGPAAAEELPTRDPGLPRENLLLYRDARGAIKRVETPADWEHRRENIVAAMQAVMGPLPDAEKRCDLDVRIEEETDCGSHVRRLISYSSEPGCRTPAYLLIPKACLEGESPAPGILCLHPTDNRLGHKVVVGLGDLERHRSREYARELAERGFVTLAPSYPLLADYQPDIRKLGYRSGTMKAVWDNMRGVDLLLSLPFVRKGGVGAIGHSLGGHNAVYTAVFDERIGIVVSSCGLDAYTDYYGGDEKRWKDGQGWCQLRYMPDLARYRGRLEEIPFDFHEMIGALAPRKVLISAPLGDGNFRWRSVDRVAASARQVYRLHDAAENLRVEHPDCGHDFPGEMRAAAYRLLGELNGEDH